jgi:undecaprenyl-diphosphatase
MDWLSALILGIVEGISEFLPISSTAHLRLVGQWLGVTSSDFSKSFDIFIQLGAILAVLIVYLKTIWQRPRIILKLAAAFVPTAIIGLAAYPLVKGQLMDSFWLMAATLGLGGLFLLWFERRYQPERATIKEVDQITYKQAVLIGLCQSVAIVPGVSRSAATIIGGLALGLKRSTIVEFSFLLALPTMLAATSLDLLKSSWSLGRPEIIALAIGSLAAFITAWFSVKWLLNFIRQRDFRLFGWYRLGLAVIVVIYLLIR